LVLACGAYCYYRRKPVAEEHISGYHELKDMKPKGTNLDGNGLGAPVIYIGTVIDQAAVPSTSAPSRLVVAEDGASLQSTIDANNLEILRLRQQNETIGAVQAGKV
jgi:hypothetical protein